MLQSPGAVSGSGSEAASGSRDALDVRYSLAALADDYTKRKHVVRVTTAAGAELLLQVMFSFSFEHVLWWCRQTIQEYLIERGQEQPTPLGVNSYQPKNPKRLTPYPYPYKCTKLIYN